MAGTILLGGGVVLGIEHRATAILNAPSPGTYGELGGEENYYFQRRMRLSDYAVHLCKSELGGHLCHFSEAVPQLPPHPHWSLQKQTKVLFC